MMSFGNRLRQLREDRGLSQLDLSKHLNIANSTLSLYEAGKREPDYDTLQRLADYFDVSTDYLLGRSEYKKPPTDLAEIIKEESVTYEGRPVDIDQLRKALSNVRAAAHATGDLTDIDVQDEEALLKIAHDALQKARELRRRKEEDKE